MTTTSTELDRVAAAVYEAGNKAGFAASDIARADQTGDTSRLRDAFRKAKEASSLADSALTRLVAMGAKRPSAKVAEDDLPLHLLDTPETRRLLVALEETAKAAADVDRQRGWVNAEGEPIGWGEMLAGLVFALQREVGGMPGRD